MKNGFLPRASPVVSKYNVIGSFTQRFTLDITYIVWEGTGNDEHVSLD